MFKLSRTYSDPGNSQTGFATPGEGAQSPGQARPVQEPRIPWVAERPTKGRRSFFRPAEDGNVQRGFAEPLNADQQRPRGSMPNIPPVFGGVNQNYTPYYDRGAAAFVPNFGYVLTNPIGAGIVAKYRPQATYGGSAQFFNGIAFWTSQVIPTSVRLQGLTDPQALLDILGQLNVEAAVRVA